MELKDTISMMTSPDYKDGFLYEDQMCYMWHYLDILKERARIKGIDLEDM